MVETDVLKKLFKAFPNKGTGVVVVEENLPAYCPHCGVRMDGRRLEEKENETEEL